MATARDLIRSNTGPQSGLVFNGDYAQSFFTPVGWRRTTNHSTQKFDFIPINNQVDAAGATLEFRPPKTCDFLGFPTLQEPFSAITGGAGGTVARLVDYAVPHSVNNISVSHVSNLLTRFDGSVYLPIYLKNSEKRRREQWDPLLLGNLSPTTRNLLGQAAQVGYLPLDGLFWFTYSTHTFCPIIVLSHELRIEVTFNSIGTFVQDNSGNTPTCTISTQVIRGISYPLAMTFLNTHVTGDERTYQTSLYQQDGLLSPFKEFKGQPRQLIPSGTSGRYSFRLTSIKDQISEMYWIIRRQSDVTGDFTRRPNNRLSFVSFSFTGNGGEMVAENTYEWMNRRLREHFHSSRTAQTDGLGFYSFCWAPEKLRDNTGSVHFGVISDPTLNINLGTNVGDSECYDVLNGFGEAAQNLVIDFWVDAFNWVHYVGGDINKTFN